MGMESYKNGKAGEDIAERYLIQRGYKIIERNYRSSQGEVDIIAREKDTFAFIEVKTRRSTAFGPPQMAVNQKKQEQLSKAALYFLKEKRLEEAKARFDVVAILLGAKGEEIELIRDAFELQYI